MSLGITFHTVKVSASYVLCVGPQSYCCTPLLQPLRLELLLCCFITKKICVESEGVSAFRTLGSDDCLRAASSFFLWLFLAVICSFVEVCRPQPHVWWKCFCVFLPLLSCAVIPCQPPPAIENGQFSGVHTDYTFGVAVTYSCKNGFSLIGNATIHCTADDNLNGRWSGPAPECKGKFLLPLLLLLLCFSSFSHMNSFHSADKQENDLSLNGFHSAVVSHSQRQGLVQWFLSTREAAVITWTAWA